MAVTKCNRTQNADCKDDAEVDRLFNNMYFTFNTVVGMVILKNPNKPSANPVSYTNEFHSQFELGARTYRDNNNFLRHNLVETRDNRYNFLETETMYDFMDIIKGQHWTKTKSELKRASYVSRDFENFQEEQLNIIFGSYFFYSTEKVEH